jgi:hypothetical protein
MYTRKSASFPGESDPRDVDIPSVLAADDVAARKTYR